MNTGKQLPLWEGWWNKYLRAWIPLCSRQTGPRYLLTLAGPLLCEETNRCPASLDPDRSPWLSSVPLPIPQPLLPLLNCISCLHHLLADNPLPPHANFCAVIVNCLFPKVFISELIALLVYKLIKHEDLLMMKIMSLSRRGLNIGYSLFKVIVLKNSSL